MDVTTITDTIERYIRPATLFSGCLDAGMEATHKHGSRYPVTTFMNYTAKFPESYEAAWDVWGEPRPGSQETRRTTR
jgi:hypothetical protein